MDRQNREELMSELERLNLYAEALEADDHSCPVVRVLQALLKKERARQAGRQRLVEAQERLVDAVSALLQELDPNVGEGGE